MILLILVAALWVVVLTPSALRRLGERQGAGSIDHFHRQLSLLEHAGPKLVAPAYRLRTGGDGNGSIPSTEVSTSRPKLVLLRQVDDERSADIEGQDGAHYERVGVLEAPQPEISAAQTRAELATYRRQEARRRCTIALRLLTAAALSTGIVGFFPSLRGAWFFTGLTGIAAFALVGLIAYAREVEIQRRRRRPTREAQFDAEQKPVNGAALAGHPGAWDDEVYVPDHAASGR